jgi:hypothetical protein
MIFWFKALESSTCNVDLNLCHPTVALTTSSASLLADALMVPSYTQG